MKVAYAYALFPNAQAALEILRRGAIGQFAAELAMLKTVAGAVAEAMELMNPLVLSRSERERVLQIARDVRKGGE